MAKDKKKKERIIQATNQSSHRVEDVEKVTDIFVTDKSSEFDNFDKKVQDKKDLIKDIEDNIQYINSPLSAPYTLQLRPALNKIKEGLENIKAKI